MKMQENAFLKAIRAGKPQIGIWLSLASTVPTEIIAGAGFDWLLVDMEHSPNDLQSVIAQLQVLAAYPGTAIVRPDWNDPVKVKRLLDAGAPGLLFPMVQNAGEAAAAVAATRYPPRGMRGMAGSTRANKYGRITDYLARVEDETAVLVQAESRAALDGIEAIADTDGVDGVFFGPADIATDMGLEGQALHPDVWDAVRQAAKKLIARGMPVGTLVTDPDFARQLLDEGFSFVACGVDSVMLARASDALIAKMRG